MDYLIIPYYIILGCGSELHERCGLDIVLFGGCRKDSTSTDEHDIFNRERCDVILGGRIFAATAKENDIQATTFLKLTSTTQNNVVWDDKIVNKASGYPPLCPKTALLWSILQMKANNAPYSKPLSRFMTPTGRLKTPTVIYKTLKTTVKFCSPNLGFEAKDVPARSLCAAGNMLILYAGIDSDIINIIR